MLHMPQNRPWLNRYNQMDLLSARCNVRESSTLQKDSYGAYRCVVKICQGLKAQKTAKQTMKVISRNVR